MCAAAKLTLDLSRANAFYLPGIGWCRVWHPSVSALTGYQAGHFPAWEELPGSQRMSKLSELAAPKTLGHLVQSWLALCLSVGSLLPYGPPCHKYSSSWRIYYLDSATVN